MNRRRSSLPTHFGSVLTTSNERPRRASWLSGSIASFSTKAKKTLIGGKQASPEAEAKDNTDNGIRKQETNSSSNPRHTPPDKLRRARRRQELAAKALQRQGSRSQIKDSNNKSKKEDWRRRSSSSPAQDNKAEMTLLQGSGMNDSMRGNLEIASLVPGEEQEQEDRPLGSGPRHRRRLKLSRKANRRFVSELEVLEWQSEKQTLCVHKNSLESQRMALRNLRSTSRQLQRPFRRRFLAMEQATRDQTMFSVIPEGNPKHQPRDAGTTNRVLITEPTRPALSEVARETQALAELDGKSKESSDLVLTDRYARLILTQHNQHQNQNTGLERCMDILRYVSERRGVDEEEEEDEEQDDHSEERSTFTTTTGCLTIDFLEDEASFNGAREDCNWDNNSIMSFDASEKSQQSASSISSRSSGPLLLIGDGDSSNNLVVTDHFANLIMAKHQQHAGGVRRASQSGMEVLQSISSSFRVPSGSSIAQWDARKTRRQSTGSFSISTKTNASLFSKKESSSKLQVADRFANKQESSNNLQVTDHFANLIMAKHQEHLGKGRRVSQSGMEVLQSISGSFRLPSTPSMRTSQPIIEV